MGASRGQEADVTSAVPAWSLLLAAAEALTARGNTPFSRDQLLSEVLRTHPDRRPGSLGPVLQGLTANAPGGVPSPAGRPLERVGRGSYRLVGALTDSPPPGGSPVATPDDPAVPPREPRGRTTSHADVVLVGCVKTKQTQPAPARELFTSPLFARRASYAESSGLRWFILSAKHALVAPEDWLAPYDVYLADQSPSYRSAWGAWVVERLAWLVGPLAGRRLEVHAGAAYVEPLRAPAAEHGAHIETPLAGLGVGAQLAWYDDPPAGGLRQQSGPVEQRSTQEDETSAAVERLLRTHEAKTPAELTANPRPEWQVPGLYAWWVDQAGAADLTAGLGEQVDAGLVYVGQAGATRWPSGRRSTNTLHGRLVGMHLGTRARFSTFRLTLGAALRTPLALDDPDDPRLSAWMQEHLRVVVLPIPDGDAVARLEPRVLAQLDPPLNLQGRPKNALRTSLSERRRGWE